MHERLIPQKKGQETVHADGVAPPTQIPALRNHQLHTFQSGKGFVCARLPTRVPAVCSWGNEGGMDGVRGGEVEKQRVNSANHIRPELLMA